MIFMETIDGHLAFGSGKSHPVIHSLTNTWLAHHHLRSSNMGCHFQSKYIADFGPTTKVFWARSWKKLQYEFPKMRGVQRPFETFPKFIRFGSATRPWGKCGRGWCFINLYLLFHKCAILMYTFQHLARVKVFLPMYPSLRHNLPLFARNFPIFPKFTKNLLPPPLMENKSATPIILFDGALQIVLLV